MKETKLDQLLVGASTQNASHKRQFISETMQRIRLQQASSQKPKRSYGLVNRVRKLHGAVLALVILVVLLILGGSAYAIIWSIPHIFHVDKVVTNSRGQTQYTVNTFPSCTASGIADESNVQQFALKKSAPKLSNEEVGKILQAKCELLNIDNLIRTTWPTYGSHSVWQNGDGIFYARADLLGPISTVTKHKLVLIRPGGTVLQSKSYDVQPGKQLRVIGMDDGQTVPLTSLKSGDIVMSVVEVEETFNGSSAPSSNPRVLGAIGAVKLDLPLAYYTTYQGYLTDINNCFGNSGELCPSTSGITIYPRTGGESATNPYATPQGKDAQSLQIDGTVSKLSANSITLKSSRGNTYTVTIGENGYSEYNNQYAPSYIAEGYDAKLRLGSFVDVSYVQARGSNPRTITPQQVQMISLLLDDSSNPKLSGAKQY